MSPVMVAPRQRMVNPGLGWVWTNLLSPPAPSPIFLPFNWDNLKAQMGWVPRGGVESNSNGGSQTPLSQNSNVAVSLNRFVAENSAFSMDQITNQRRDRSITPLRSQLGGPRLRYVNDPLNPGAVIDMRHMLIIGESGNFTGGLVELLQWSTSQSSGFDIQDFYSNNLGQYFYKEYGALIQANPNMASQYIGEFLFNPDFSYLRVPYNNYVK